MVASDTKRGRLNGRVGQKARTSSVPRGTPNGRGTFQGTGPRNLQGPTPRRPARNAGEKKSNGVYLPGRTPPLPGRKTPLDFFSLALHAGRRGVGPRRLQGPTPWKVPRPSRETKLQMDPPAPSSTVGHRVHTPNGSVGHKARTSEWLRRTQSADVRMLASDTKRGRPNGRTVGYLGLGVPWVCGLEAG